MRCVLSEFFCVSEIQNGKIFKWGGGEEDVKIQLEFRKNDGSVASDHSSRKSPVQNSGV